MHLSRRLLLAYSLSERGMRIARNRICAVDSRMVTMRDGVRLATDVFLPRREGSPNNPDPNALQQGHLRGRW